MEKLEIPHEDIIVVAVKRNTLQDLKVMVETQVHDANTMAERLENQTDAYQLMVDLAAVAEEYAGVACLAAQMAEKSANLMRDLIRIARPKTTTEGCTTKRA